MARRLSYQSVLENHALKLQSMGKMDKILSDRMDALEKNLEKNQTTQLAEINSDIAFLKDSLSKVTSSVGEIGKLQTEKTAHLIVELSSVKAELSSVQAELSSVKGELDEVMKMYEEN